MAKGTRLRKGEFVQRTYTRKLGHMVSVFSGNCLQLLGLAANKSVCLSLDSCNWCCASPKLFSDETILVNPSKWERQSYTTLSGEFLIVSTTTWNCVFLKALSHIEPIWRMCLLNSNLRKAYARVINPSQNNVSALPASF